jgi:arylsulfatase A-like enzyme
MSEDAGCSASREFDTPHLDRFARRSVRFDRHFVGSLPCMPARHDILMGARSEHFLFDHEEDPDERRNLVGTAAERDAIDLLRSALEEVEAPAEHFERMGIE